MSYSHYRGKNGGRILHAVHVYCGLNYAEYIKYGDGKITYQSKPFATYSFPEDIKNDHENDGPLLRFDPTVKDSEYFEKNQFFQRPYLDDFAHRDNIRYVIQEVQKCMNFTSALAFKHARDKLNGDFDSVIFEDKNNVILKIQETIKYAAHGYFSPEHWKHVVLCAIYDI